MKILCYGIDNTTQEMKVEGNIEKVNVTYLKYLPLNSFNKEYKYRRYIEDPEDGYLLRGMVVGIFGTMNTEDYYPYCRIFLAIDLIFSILKHKKDTEENE